jgi:hypothetical protein
MPNISHTGFRLEAVYAEGAPMITQHIPVTGGCLCGAIRFECTKLPIEGYYCHCSLCQRAYGGLFSATLRVPASGFRFTKGEPKSYGATKLAKRAFCADCGSPMPFFYEGNPNVWIKIGSLDHPEDWPMIKGAPWGQSAHWHTDTKIAWEAIDDGLPQPTETLPEHVRRLAQSE